MNWKFWVAAPPAKTRHTATPALPTEESREAAFLKAPDNDLFLAVLADLQEFAVEVSDRALDRKLPEAEVRWHLGGCEALLEFLERLQERERDARLTAEQLEAKRAEETPETQ